MNAGTTNEQLTYPPPLQVNDYWGKETVAGLFNIYKTPYAVAFNEITNHADLLSKGYRIKLPGFHFPQNGMVEVMFDSYNDPINYGSFQHIRLKGFQAGLVLRNVAYLISLHYTVRKPGGYAFMAAPNASGLRTLDLKNIYDEMLGLSSPDRVNFRTGRLKKHIRNFLPPSWVVHSGLGPNGRSYVIICQK